MTLERLKELIEKEKTIYDAELREIKKELDEIKNIVLYKMVYKMVVYPAETQDGIQWNVEFENILGTGGSGNTPEEAIKDAQQNLKVHLDFLSKENKEGE